MELSPDPPPEHVGVAVPDSNIASFYNTNRHTFVKLLQYVDNDNNLPQRPVVFVLNNFMTIMATPGLKKGSKL